MIEPEEKNKRGYLLTNYVKIYILNSLASGCFRGFSEKKGLTIRGFAGEYLRSWSGYGPS